MVGKGTSFLDWDILKPDLLVSFLWNVTNDKYNAGVRMVIKAYESNKSVEGGINIVR